MRSFILFLLLLPLSATAQIAISLNTGVNMHNGPINAGRNMGSQPGFTFDGRLLFKTKHIDAGIGITHGWFQNPDNISNFGVPYVASDPFTSYYGLCNIKIHPRRLYYYAGANAGVLHINGKETLIYYSPDAFVSDPNGSMSAATGFVMGAEAGAGYKLNKRFDLHIGAAGKYAFMKYDNIIRFTPQKFQYAYYQLLVGATFLISE